jgi:hypothetical protein
MADGSAVETTKAGLDVGCGVGRGIGVGLDVGCGVS